MLVTHHLLVKSLLNFVHRCHVFVLTRQRWGHNSDQLRPSLCLPDGLFADCKLFLCETISQITKFHNYNFVLINLNLVQICLRPSNIESPSVITSRGPHCVTQRRKGNFIIRIKVVLLNLIKTNLNSL